MSNNTHAVLPTDSTTAKDPFNKVWRRRAGRLATALVVAATAALSLVAVTAPANAAGTAPTLTSVTIDSSGKTTAPLTPGSTTVTTSTSPSFSGTGTAGDELTINAVSTSGTVTKLCTLTVDLAGNWACTTTTPLAGGIYSVSASDQTASLTSPTVTLDVETAVDATASSVQVLDSEEQASGASAACLPNPSDETGTEDAPDCIRVAVTVVGTNGGIIPPNDADVTVAPTVSSQTVTASTVTANTTDGTSDFTLSSTFSDDEPAGKVGATVTLESANPVALTPASYEFSPGNADQNPLSVDNAKAIRADGAASHTITITLTDNTAEEPIVVYFLPPSNNPGVLITPDKVTIDPASIQNGLGTATAKVTSVEGGVIPISASLDQDGTDPLGTVNAVFETRPAAPTVAATDGTVLTGGGAIGDTITVTDTATNAVVGTAVVGGATAVGTAGTWTVTPASPLAIDDVLQVMQSNPANSSSPVTTVKVGSGTAGLASQEPMIITNLVSTHSYGDSPDTISTAGGTGSGAVQYTSSDPSVATVTSAGVLSFVKAGTFTVTATKAGGTNLASATVVSPTITVGLAIPKLEISAQATSSTQTTLTATVLPVGVGRIPEGTVTFDDQDGSPATVALISNGTAAVASTVVTTPTSGANGYIVTYSGQPGYYDTTGGLVAVGDENGDLLNQAPLELSGLASSYIYGQAPVTVGTTGGSGIGAVTYTSSDPQVAAVTNAGVVTILQAGTFTLTATKAADDAFDVATVTSPTVTVTAASPTVTVTATASATSATQVTLTASVFPVGTGAVATGTVSFSTGTGTPVTATLTASGTKAVASTTVTLPTTGTATYTASYSGQTNAYLSAQGTITLSTAATAAPTVTYANAAAVRGTAAANAEVTVYAADGVTQLGQATATANGVYLVPISPAQAGGSAVEVTATAGGITSLQTKATVDATAPTAPVVNPSQGKVVTGTAEAGSTVKVTAPVAATATASATTVLLGSALVGPTGTFSITLDPAQPSGTQVSVTATDAAQNVSAVTPVTVRVTITMSRIQGPDRYSTAVAAAQQQYPNGASTVILAVGTNYPDAISAAPAAVKLNAPILLTQTNTLTGTTLQELNALHPSRVIVLGDTVSVSAATFSAVQSQVTSKPSVVRIAGADRYATNQQLVNYVWGGTTASTVVVATGQNFTDAESAASAASKLGAPLVLVNGSAASLDSATSSLLTGLGAKTIHVVGSTANLTAGVYTGLQGIGTTLTDRTAGTDAVSTSIAVSQAFFPTASSVYIATTDDFPDALVAGALAGKAGAPVLFTVDSLSPGISTEVLRLTATKVYVMGDPTRITAAAYNTLAAALGITS